MHKISLHFSLAILLFSPAAAIAGLINPTVIDTIPVPVRAFGVAVNPAPTVCM